jgi:hypothetical protein
MLKAFITTLAILAASPAAGMDGISSRTRAAAKEWGSCRVQAFAESLAAGMDNALAADMMLAICLPEQRRLEALIIVDTGNPAAAALFIKRLRSDSINAAIYGE